MKYNNEVEVLLFSNHPITKLNQEELLKWLATRIQPLVLAQHERIREFVLAIWKDTPPLYMS